MQIDQKKRCYTGPFSRSYNHLIGVTVGQSDFVVLVILPVLGISLMPVSFLYKRSTMEYQAKIWWLISKYLLRNGAKQFMEVL